MNTNAPLSATITPTNNTVHQTTTYTFSLAFTVAHKTGDQLIITFPEQVTPPASSNCMPLLGLTGMSCTVVGQEVTVTMSFGVFPVDFRVSF
jgi:hypothetical protein